MAANHDDPTFQSKADVWWLKRISFDGKEVPIITQNFNGPCSFIAICNILLLRGNISILPPTRQTVSYEFLSQLVAEYLLMRSPDVDISAALSIMPHTQKGLDLNPIFTSSTSFRPATETAGGELALFAQVGIDLVHGWLVDPNSDEARAMREEGAEDYDNAVSLIAEADHIAGGLLVGEGDNGGEGEKRDEEWTDVDRRKIRNALVIRQFLEQTQSQLTYHGLFHLASTLPEGTPVAVFRSSHLSVLYKSGTCKAPAVERGSQILHEMTPEVRPTVGMEKPTLSTRSNPTPSAPDETQPESATLHPGSSTSPPSPLPPPATIPSQDTQLQSHLYTLATDQVFLHEPSVVWERIEDVDGAAGVFVDSHFSRGVPSHGDWALSAAVPVGENAPGEGRNEISDAEIARQLQAEEDRYAYQLWLLQQQQVEIQQREDDLRQKELHAKRAKGKKKLSNCIIS